MMRRLGALAICVGLAACQSTGPAGPPGPPVYLVRFFGDGAAILPRTAMVLNTVAAEANRHHNKLVEVAGAEPKRAHGAGQRRTKQRVAAIEQALTMAGVDERRIVEGQGPASMASTNPKDGEEVRIQLVDKAPPTPPPPKAVRKAKKSRN
jgi:hypothetical protein